MQVIEVAKHWLKYDADPDTLIDFLDDRSWYEDGKSTPLSKIIAFMKFNRR